MYVSEESNSDYSLCQSIIFRDEIVGFLAARPGFEPGLKDSKSFVLPLHHRALGITSTIQSLPRESPLPRLRYLLETSVTVDKDSIPILRQRQVG